MEVPISHVATRMFENCDTIKQAGSKVHPLLVYKQSSAPFTEPIVEAPTLPPTENPVRFFPSTYPNETEIVGAVI